jgi:hypothetical protein
MIGTTRTLAALPLLLWKTPPALETLLAQEGVAYRVIEDDHPFAFRAGRFVVFDGKHVSKQDLRTRLKPEHFTIDVQSLREDEAVDPFVALLETRGQVSTWRLQHLNVSESVNRVDKAKLRRKILGKLRDIVQRADGVWARLASFPYPYRSAFNLRVDLDEHVPDDYFSFAAARTPIAGATTHFVSTRAYGDSSVILEDLRKHDTHSHGHYHVIYREATANRVNLRRALDRLDLAGIDGKGFASPHGRWNLGLNEELEELGCEFASEFQLGYDDLPFHPWLGNRRSKILQIPVHPICEGLFFDSGAEGPAEITNHLVATVRAKIEAGEPAFVYGHPERRLGKFPSIVSRVAEVANSSNSTWKVSLSQFARWWKWRNSRGWSLVPRGDRAYELQLDEWDARYSLGLEIYREKHVALMSIESSTCPIRLAELAYERRAIEYSLPAPIPKTRDFSLRAAVRRAIDWETVTPIEDLPTFTLRSRIKRELRSWREKSRTLQPG